MLRALTSLGVLTLIFTAPVLAQGGDVTNLMPNGDFEQGDIGQWNTNPDKRIAIEKIDDAPSGEYALVLDCPQAQYYFAAAGPNTPIEPRQLYRIRATIKRTTGAGYLRIGGGYLDKDKQGLKRGSWSLNTFPLNLTPGEGAGRWLTYEGTFLPQRTDAAFFAPRIIIRDGVDTVYVDDLSIEKVQRPPAPPLTFPDDVQCPGEPSRMGMRVEDANAVAAGAAAVTTGALYQFDAQGRTLTCFQLIPEERAVVTLTFDPPLGALKLQSRSEDAAVLAGEQCALSVNGDSLIALGTNRRLTITITSAIVPQHYQLVSDNLMTIDEQGGFCVYPEQRLEFEGEGSVFTIEPESTSQPGWQATLSVGARKRVAIAVFPPKPFPWEQSFTDRIAHSNRYPSDEAIRSMAKYCDILVLHQNIYTGGSSAGPYVIEDDNEYARVIATAHDAGMKVCPYFNPGAYAEQDPDVAIKLLTDHRQRYGTDGFYFDGLYRKDEWATSYYFIRRIRTLVGESCIYTHCTLNPPANMPAIYCPFIDAYSDFLLRGEGQTIEGPDDPYLRYVVGAYNISNSIATLKGDQMKNADEKQQLEVMLKLNGRARWPYPGTNPERDELFTGWYFPTLDRMKAEWEAGEQPMP